MTIKNYAIYIQCKLNFTDGNYKDYLLFFN